MPAGLRQGGGVRLGGRGSWLFWIATLLLVTAALVSVRSDLDQAHATLIYLLIVLGGSASAGRALGFTLACASVLIIDYFLQTPFDKLAIDKPLDWLVLLAFLVTAAVATQLLGRANAEAEAARRRAEEIDRLAALGAETLNLGRADDALEAIVNVIRQTTGAEECQIYAGGSANAGTDAAEFQLVAGKAGAALAPASLATLASVAAKRRVATERLDGTPVHSGAAHAGAALDAELAAARTLLLPLVVHERSVGVLRLADRGGLRLDPARRRFLDALSYYAALGVERVHLVVEAEHAEALREADRLKDALLASVSHDLRTPLTTIKALAHDISGSGDERAAVIEQQADRLNHMVADLLDLSRLNAGSVPVHTEINAAEDLVGAAIQQAAGALAGRELRTALELGEPMPVGRFDFVHSLRILVNLIENAVKYSPPASPIEISMRGEGDLLAIAVADRGRGVAPAERERIFEPFYRPAGVAPDGRTSGSAGLGLAIARRLAQAQGGTLVYEDRLGGGSIFTLRLPSASLDPEAVAWDAP